MFWTQGTANPKSKEGYSRCREHPGLFEDAESILEISVAEGKVGADYERKQEMLRL